METLYFEYFEDLVSDIVDTLDNFNSISIVAKYEETKKFIKEILFYENYELEDIELSSPEFNGYENEFAISIIDIDGTYKVWCKPMKRDTGYFNIEFDIAYILSNCSSDVLKHCDLENSYCVIVDDIDVNTELGIKIEEDDLDCKSCCYCDKCKLDKENDDNDKHENHVKIGNSTVATTEWVVNSSCMKSDDTKKEKSDSKNELSIDTKTVYKVNGKEVSKELFEKKKREIDNSVNNSFKMFSDLNNYFDSWNKVFNRYLL